MRQERGSAVKAMVLVSTVVAAAFLLTQRQKVASAAGSISTNTPLSGANTNPPRDTAAFDAFEDQFEQLFCEGQSAVFAAVISTNGMREFVFYVSDETRFRKQFRAWGETPKSHRIQLMVQRDVSWSVYRQLCA